MLPRFPLEQRGSHNDHLQKARTNPRASKARTRNAYACSHVGGRQTRTEEPFDLGKRCRAPRKPCQAGWTFTSPAALSRAGCVRGEGLITGRIGTALSLRAGRLSGMTGDDALRRPGIVSRTRRYCGQRHQQHNHTHGIPLQQSATESLTTERIPHTAAESEV